MQIIVHAEGGILVNSGIIVSLMDTVAMRLITVGVIMLERHEILEMVGAKNSSSRHDPLADLSQPYGMYYLCGGLIMECCVDALKHPFRLFAGSIHDGIVLAAVMLFALISVLVSLRYAYDLLIWRRRIQQREG